MDFCQDLYICSGALQQLLCLWYYIWQFAVKFKSGLQMTLCNENFTFKFNLKTSSGYTHLFSIP